MASGKQKVGKRRQEGLKKVDAAKLYDIDSACALAKEVAFAKFDESVDLAVNLGVNAKQADQMVRGAVVLPHGLGKTRRVAVFAKGEKANEATAAGADVVGADDLLAKVNEGFLDFDVVIATPDMMGVVGRLGKVLGPRGLMPNPKVGTVTTDVAKAVKESKAGKVEFRIEKAGIVHAPIGKKSFDAAKLADNARTVLAALVKAKPSTSKGTYLKAITLNTTMGPGLHVDPNSVQSAEA